MWGCVARNYFVQNVSVKKPPTPRQARLAHSGRALPPEAWLPLPVLRDVLLYMCRPPEVPLLQQCVGHSECPGCDIPDTAAALGNGCHTCMHLRRLNHIPGVSTVDCVQYQPARGCTRWRCSKGASGREHLCRATASSVATPFFLKDQVSPGGSAGVCSRFWVLEI